MKAAATDLGPASPGVGSVAVRRKREPREDRCGFRFRLTVTEPAA